MTKPFLLAGLFLLATFLAPSPAFAANKNRGMGLVLKRTLERRDPKRGESMGAFSETERWCISSIRARNQRQLLAELDRARTLHKNFSTLSPEFKNIFQQQEELLKSSYEEWTKLCDERDALSRKLTYESPAPTNENCPYPELSEMYLQAANSYAAFASRAAEFQHKLRQKLQEQRDKTVLAADKVKDKKFPRSRIVDEAEKLRVSSRQGNGFGTLLKVAEDYRTLDRASASDYRQSSAQTAQFTSRCASVRGPR